MKLPKTKTFQQRVKTIIKSKRFVLLSCSIINGVIATIITFWSDTLHYTFNGEKFLMQKTELLCRVFGDTDKPCDDFFPINVGFDQQLVPAYIEDSYGNEDDYGKIPVGERAIVNRSTLFQLLTMLEGTDYKYIVLDVIFHKNDETESDSALFSIINRIPRIACTYCDEITPKINKSKTAYSNYTQTFIESDFVKYQYYGNGRQSIAKFAYDNRMNDDRGLRFNTILLPLTYRPLLNTNDIEIYNARTDILECYDKNELSILTKDKIIIIGDYGDGDSHTTYTGTLSGPVIIANAILALKNGHDRLNIFVTIWMIVVYTLMSAIFFDLIRCKMPRFIAKSKFLTFLASFFNISFLVAVSTGLIYILSGTFHSIYLPVIYLTITYNLSSYLTTWIDHHFK